MTPLEKSRHQENNLPNNNYGTTNSSNLETNAQVTDNDGEGEGEGTDIADEDDDEDEDEGNTSTDDEDESNDQHGMNEDESDDPLNVKELALSFDYLTLQKI
ncbi:unnamed protein product [[Candida] boidinii]|nr:unnamed protein product [[Candida] boidinii]